MYNGCVGFVSQTLLVEPEFGEWEQLEFDIFQFLLSIKNK